jgi:hypothetical protein
MRRLKVSILGAGSLLLWALLFPSPVLPQSPVVVRYTEGLLHGFLVLRTLESNTIADGEVTEAAHGERVTSHLIFFASRTARLTKTPPSFLSAVLFG